MTDGYALLRAIEANPREDTPRLAYADWLEENATSDVERARADFIRAECERARHPDFARRPELATRVMRLLTEHGKAWLAELPGQQFNDGFRRGFVCPLHLPAWNFVRHAEQLAAVAPLHHVHLFQARSCGAELAACPQLGFVRHLDLRNGVMRNGHLAALVESPHLGNLATLTAAENLIGVAGCQALAGAHLPALRHLALNSNPIRFRGLAALQAAAWFPQLESLYVGGCGLPEADVVALAADPRAANLRALHVYAPRDTFTAAAGHAILASPHLAGLQRLWIACHTFNRPLADALRTRFGDRLNGPFFYDEDET